MSRGDRDVLNPRCLGQRNPGAGVELGGIERRSEPLVVGDGNGPVLHDPFAVAEQAVDAPVDKHPELGVAIPLARGAALGGNRVRRLDQHGSNDQGVEDAGRSPGRYWLSRFARISSSVNHAGRNWPRAYSGAWSK